MQEISLNEEFFEENLQECAKRVHPIGFLQEYFSAEEANFNKILNQNELIAVIQARLQSPMDMELLEELFDRVQYEKKKNLTLNEFFKVFHEAETVLLLKTEYIRFLLEQNNEIQTKIETLIKNEHFLNDLHDKNPLNNKNLIKITLVRLIGYKENPCSVNIKYEHKLFESTTAKENGAFSDPSFEIPLISLDSLIEFTVLADNNNKNESFSIGKANLSLLYLDLTSKNQVKLVINQGVLELIVILELLLNNKKSLQSLFEEKLNELNKEQMRFSQEKHGFKTQLGLLIRPFNRKFDPDEYYNFDNIPIGLPKSLKIFEGMPIEQKQSGLSVKISQNPMKSKEIREEFEIQTIEMRKTKEIDNYNNKNYNENNENYQKYNENYQKYNENNEELSKKVYSLEKFQYPLEKSSIQKKIEQIIAVNQDEKHIQNIEKEENMSFWKRFLLRSDILAIVYVLVGLLVNSQRNLFLDVIFFIFFKRTFY